MANNITSINKNKGKEPETVRYAREELRIILNACGYKAEQANINKDIIELVKVIVKQGNDGQALLYELQTLERLLSFKPLSPIMGTPEEWKDPEERDGYLIYQNKRCLSVYKVTDKDGKIVDLYDTEALICSDDGGHSWFVTPKFVKQIKFPYAVPESPERAYIKLDGDTYVPVTDVEEIKKMYNDTIARKQIMQK